MHAQIDVIVKALGSFQCITLVFCLGGALEDVLFSVVPHPPVAGCWDFENYQLARVARNPCDGVL
jgi:hypothetical protein